MEAPSHRRSTATTTLHLVWVLGFALITGVAQHDDTNFGTGNTVRGDLTQVQRLISGTSTYLTTSTNFDTTGQTVTSTDGNGNVTTYSYADNFFNDNGDTSNPVPYTPPGPTNAFLKTITKGGITNTYGYYWGTGERALSTDPNNQTTYSHYFDSLSRRTSTKRPDNGWTFKQYSSTGTQIDAGIGITSTAFTTNCPASSNACRHDQTLLDGLGRVTSSVLISDPNGATTTATAYDSNGRVLKTSNPYRSTSDSTYGWTTNTYDGLDRTTQVQRQDGSLFRTFYGAQVGAGGGTTSQLCSSSSYGLGYPMLTVDEAGKKRQTWTDGFGRMMEADEPDATGSLTVATCYSYDLNNNLIAVLQNSSRQRAFTYNLLSQLLTAGNPESGTITYSYDNNGNVQTKVAPAPNQTGSATVTTTFTYDQLNRLTQKSFSDGTTPTVKYGYDAIAPSGCTLPTLTINNGIGKRTGMCDAAGAEAWSYDITAGVGWKLTDARTTNNVPKSTIVQNNLAGSPAVLTYPSGRVITYAYDAAARPISAIDSSG